MKTHKKILCILSILSLLPLAAFSAESSSNIYLEQTSRAFSQIAKKAIPAVVFIKAQYGGPEETARSPDDYENPFDYFGDEFFRRFFGQPGHPGFGHQQAPQIAGGSGFIVSSDGYIVTNNHVVKDAKKITVVMNTGNEEEAKLIGSDPRTDLAIIKIEAKNLPFLVFDNSDDLEIGEWAIAIGSPFALQSSLTVGVISAKGRDNLKISDLEDFIQTDAAINPGNSGGPLLNIKGEVVGVNTAIVSRSGGYMGIGFAIPSNMAKYVMNQIIHNGTVKRGFLGVYFQPIDKEMAEAFNLEKTDGVLISEVMKDSPAEKSGLKQGDIIIEYNGKVIKSPMTLKNEINLLEPGTEIELKILRDGKGEKVKVVLGTSKEEILSQQSTQLGLDIAEIKEISPNLLQKWGYAPNAEGLIITAIKPGSFAEKVGLHPGMMILQVNQVKVKNKADFQEATKGQDQKKHLLLLIRFQNVTRFVTLKMQ